LVKKRVGKKNTFFGHTHTDATKKKISKANSIHLTTDQEKLILELYKKHGMSNISKQTGLGCKKISNVLKKHKVNRRKIGPIRGSRLRTFNEKEKELIKSMVENHTPIKVIIKTLKTSHGTLKRFLEEEEDNDI